MLAPLIGFSPPHFAGSLPTKLALRVLSSSPPPTAIQSQYSLLLLPHTTAGALSGPLGSQKKHHSNLHAASRMAAV